MPSRSLSRFSVGSGSSRGSSSRRSRRSRSSQRSNGVGRGGTHNNNNNNNKQKEQQNHPVTRALVIVFGTLFVFPAGFAYYVLVTHLRELNVCHVGPVKGLQPNPQLDNPEKFQSQRDMLLDLYGTYTTFDDASYYFVKTPYEITPLCLPSFGWWSITTLYLTLLSPQLRRVRQQSFDEIDNTFYLDTSPSIQWDQSHKIQPISAYQTNQHSSQQNRWCLISQQDSSYTNPLLRMVDEETKKLQQDHQRDAAIEQARASILGATAPQQMEEVEDEHGKDPQTSMYKICAVPQASILSSGDQPPFFVELPLQPPIAGKWSRYETSELGKKAAMTEYDDDYYNNDNGGGGGGSGGMFDERYIQFQRSRQRPTNPYQIEVQCHVRDMELHHLAHGTLQPDALPYLGWEHAEQIRVPVYNVFYTPGTLLLLLMLLLIQLRPTSSRNPNDAWLPHSGHDANTPVTMTMATTHGHWNLVKAMCQQWYPASWKQYIWHSFWIFLVGICLEPVLGTLPYLGATLAFSQWIALTDHHHGVINNGLSWICFGQSILLAQLEETLSFGPVEIGSIVLGTPEWGIRANIWSVIVAVVAVLTTTTAKSNGSSGFVSRSRPVLGTLLLGWALSKPIVLELLGAPQWTLPTLMMSHLWWSISQLPPGIKKTDDEARAFIQNGDIVATTVSDANGDGNIKDDEETLSSAMSGTTRSSYSSTDSVFSFSSDVTTIRGMCCFGVTLTVHFFFVVWTIFTLFVGAFTVDWTLVVGNTMALWLCIGSLQFPRHALWTYYYMISASVMIMANMMTCAGWYLCRVAIATHVLNALPSKAVWICVGLQTGFHFVGLCNAVRNQLWTRDDPGYFLWKHMCILGEELRLWYRVFV